LGERDIRIVYDAPESIRAALERIGRTEDLQFSPNNRRLALAAFDRNSIAVIDVDIGVDRDDLKVALTALSELSSPHLRGPHGVAFLDDETIIVTSRYAGVTVFALPTSHGSNGAGELVPLGLRPSCGLELLSEPSALTIATDALGGTEVLICNNSGHTVTRHELCRDPLGAMGSEVLVHRWLDLPDGIAVSADNQWIAVSNHNAHVVMLYERAPSLHNDSDPDCILLGTIHPHGLRFSADGRQLFVADANTPYVHVYASESDRWQGVQHPAASLRVLDEDVFKPALLRYGVGMAGPKGIDIHQRGQLLATTSTREQLAFFDISAILGRDDWQRPEQGLRLSYELAVREELQRNRARIEELRTSRSYRITKPLRLLKSAFVTPRRYSRVCATNSSPTESRSRRGSARISGS